MVMKILGLFFALFAFSACTHTIKFRTSHFALPITAEHQWGGQVAASSSSVTAVTLVNDFTSNPPTRTKVRVNEDADAEDVFFLGIFSSVGLHGNLAVLNSLDVFIENSILGLRWQFLNHGSTSETWVAALQGGVGNRSESESIEGGGNISSVSSKIRTTQAGISIGYQYAQVVPYISYIQEKHEVTTDIDNQGGTFNYEDNGTHQHISLGITKKPKDLTYAFELTHTLINWDRGTPTTQNGLAAKLGFAW